jgi:hypothetical protein
VPRYCFVLAVPVAVLAITVAVSANPAHNLLVKLSEPERREKFTEFMHGSGEPCVVVRTFFQGMDSKGNAHWNVACSNKKSFGIMIYNDAVGSTKILECGVLKLFTQVECFKKFQN